MGGNNKQTDIVIAVEILIAPVISAFQNAILHVYLEDTTYADQRAVLIAESVFKNINHHPNSKSPPTKYIFCIKPKFIFDPEKIYTIRIWIDMNANGIQDKDDLFSSQAYPVLTQGFEKTVSINFI